MQTKMNWKLGSCLLPEHKTHLLEDVSIRIHAEKVLEEFAITQPIRWKMFEYYHQVASIKKPADNFDLSHIKNNALMRIKFAHHDRTDLTNPLHLFNLSQLAEKVARRKIGIDIAKHHIRAKDHAIEYFLNPDKNPDTIEQFGSNPASARIKAEEFVNNLLSKYGEDGTSPFQLGFAGMARQLRWNIKLKWMKFGFGRISSYLRIIPLEVDWPEEKLNINFLTSPHNPCCYLDAADNPVFVILPCFKVRHHCTV